MGNSKRLFDIIHNYQVKFNQEVMVAGRNGSNWKTYSTDKFVETINFLSKGLLAKGLKKGDRVALMSGNRPEWNFIDFACNQLGIALVPLYPTLANQDLSYIVNDADVKVIFVGTQELSEKLDSAVDENKLAVDIYTFNPVEGKTCYTELIELGKQHDTDLKPYKDAVAPDDLLTLIYTSGTTGKPKGVYLSHKNIMSNIDACDYLIKNDYRKALSFLPLCHIFERMVVYLYLSKGIQIYYAENLDNIVADINEIKPDVFTTVPRVLEKVYDKIVSRGKELSGIKKALFFWALELGHTYQEPKKNSAFYNFKLGIARKLIFKKWVEALGGNIKLIVSGGAALQERLARVFWAAGIKVLEGYGLTETSPVIAVNRWDDDGVRFGTVGPVLKNLDVKIASDGEILVKGPSVFTQYYKNDEATKEAFDENGYFKTGDIGELSTDNFLKITDRKKEMFKTAGGKYISPQVLENKLMESTFIGQVMVIGENQRFPAALVVPAFEQLEKWAKFKGIDYASQKELIKQPAVQEKYQSIIAEANNNFGQWEKVKKFELLPTEWTINNGELTPKLSLKRKVIMQKEESNIQKLYE